MEQVTKLVDGQNIKIPMIVCTSPQTYGDAKRMGFVSKIENAGGTVLKELVFINRGKRDRRSERLGSSISNSAKIVNILGGYGYKPALASMRDCVAAAIEGKSIDQRF